MPCHRPPPLTITRARPATAHRHSRCLPLPTTVLGACFSTHQQLPPPPPTYQHCPMLLQGRAQPLPTAVSNVGPATVRHHFRGMPQGYTIPLPTPVLRVRSAIQGICPWPLLTATPGGSTPILGVCPGTEHHRDAPCHCPIHNFPQVRPSTAHRRSRERPPTAVPGVRPASSCCYSKGTPCRRTALFQGRVLPPPTAVPGVCLAAAHHHFRGLPSHCLHLFQYKCYCPPLIHGCSPGGRTGEWAGGQVSGRAGGWAGCRTIRRNN
jgi:hypothetical protein